MTTQATTFQTFLPDPTTTHPKALAPHQLRLKRLGIDTYQELVVYMRSDCDICRSEGFEAHSRVRVRLGERSIIATLNVVHDGILRHYEASLSQAAWAALNAHEGDAVEFAHPEPVASESALRAKVYGQKLSPADMVAIVGDITEGRYSDLQLAAFVTACAGNRLDPDETLSLTQAMIAAGDRLQWPYPKVGDKHCVGGLPGNRTTLIIVPIVAALGVPIPKTSSRAITSPAGSADTMEVLAPVTLDLEAMRRVVEREGGCIVWGGTVRLSPADDVLIRVERPLDFDSDGQLVASVLSKKAAAGATHVVIDIPVGPTAKLRTPQAAALLTERLVWVGSAVGLELRVLHSDGRQPVGHGIGPALEARDVLAVLKGKPDAPADLRERSLRLAGEVLELCGRARSGEGQALAAATLDSGEAWRKFQAICEAQGGMREPKHAAHKRPLLARHGGSVLSVDNRRLSRAAKLVGAPRDAAAGIDMHVKIGDRVARGQPLFTLHAETPGELQYALSYLSEAGEVVTLGETE